MTCDRDTGDYIMWTKGDLAMLTADALDMLLKEVNDDKVYCEWCGVVAIEKGQKYCTPCVHAMVDDMAVRYGEQVLADGGLY